MGLEGLIAAARKFRSMSGLVLDNGATFLTGAVNKQMNIDCD